VRGRRLFERRAASVEAGRVALWSSRATNGASHAKAHHSNRPRFAAPQIGRQSINPTWLTMIQPAKVVLVRASGDCATSAPPIELSAGDDFSRDARCSAPSSTGSRDQAATHDNAPPYMPLKVKVRLHRMQQFRFHFALPRARSLGWLGCFAVASSDHSARRDSCAANDFPPLRPASPRPTRPNRPDDEPPSCIGCGMSVRAPLSSRFRGPFSIMRRRSASRCGSDSVPIPLDSDYPDPL
jgi:hypothetical protein